jgi:hypothetical protein
LKENWIMKREFDDLKMWQYENLIMKK